MPRVLRLTGSVAYNAFTTTPVFSAVGGPVRDILVTPGDLVRVGQTLLDVNSPDYSAARSAYLKAKDAYALADKNYQRAVDLLAHKAIAERDEQQAESDRSQAQSDVESSTDALRALGISDPEATAKAAGYLADSLARSRGGRDRRAAGGAGAVVAGRRDAMFHHLRHQHGLGSGQRVSERFGQRAHRRRGRYHHRCLPGESSADAFPTLRRRSIPPRVHCKRGSLPKTPATS